MKTPTDAVALSKKTFIILATMITINGDAQNLALYSHGTTANIDLKPAGTGTKKFWRATSEWMLAQLIPWSANRFVRKADFARISLSSFKTNVQLSSWEWDDNQFFTNQFSHPFHGSLYFNSFRSNGYNFYESAPAALLGTYVWETVMENHYPAPNDLINTGLGGITLGEMSHRLSSLIIGHRKNKARAFINDPAALIINPMGALTRMTSGQWGKPAADMHPNAILSVDAGYRTGEDRNFNAGKQQDFYARTHLQYGDPFETSRQPSSNFSMISEFASDDSSILNTLQVEGSLFTKKFASKNGLQAWNITMNYDFIKNHFFKYGGQGFRVNYMAKLDVTRHLRLQFKTGIGVLVLGALPNTYMLYGEGRDYDYCSGITLHLSAAMNIDNRVYIDVHSNAGQSITINGYESTHVFQNSRASLSVRLFKNFFVSATAANYFFNGYYKKLPNVFEHYSQYYVGAGYRLHID